MCHGQKSGKLEIQLAKDVKDNKNRFYKNVPERKIKPGKLSISCFLMKLSY